MTKKGISLIILIITIIIMIILAGAVILSFSQNNVIETTNEAVFKNDVKVFESDLNMYITKEYVDTMGLYNVKSLNADDLHAEYNGQIIANKTIKDIISTLATREKYNGKFEIFEGKLVYKGVRAEEVTWSGEVNVGVIDGNRVDTTISTSIVLPISAGTDAICTIRMLSNAGINNIDLNGKLELLDENSIPLANQPVFDIGSPSGSNTDTLRSVDVNINIDTLAEGKYKLKLKSGAISNINDITNTVDTVSDILFEVDNTPPENPVISANPTEWTNGNVLVTLTYSADTIKKEYSLDGTNWNIYSSTVEVTEYNTTVYARSKDTAGNTSGQSTITIANIDKDSPTVVFGTNGGTNLQTASTNVTITDVGSSGINTSLSKYIWDTQNEIVPVSGWTNYVNEEIVTKTGNGTYYLWIQAEDNTGNSIVTKSNGFILDNIAPINPTMVANPTSWTNGNVTVTITYPADATVKEYSTNGTTWTIYTVPVIVATNNVTVYARGRDASGNQSSQSSLTVSNIDKISPTVTFGTNGGTNLQTATTTATVSDTGGSTVNTSTIQYVWDTQNTVAPSSGWAVFTNGASLTKGSVTGTYYLWIKGLDTAGNTVVSKTNAFEIDNTAPTNPTLVANPTSWTNGNVLVTITYPADATVKEYSTNGTSWSAYTTAITVTTNITTVYARGRDASGNQSSQSTLTVSNIDKIVPTVSFGTNGGSNLQTASTTVTVSDTGGSAVNTSTIQYVWDIQNTVAPSSGWLTFTNGVSLTKGSVTGTYYLWIKGSDNAGNTIVSKTNAFVLDNTAPTNPTLVASPTSWTNGNVSVTITYPADATVKEYSTNGTTWNTYTTAITVTTNNTTVYARGRDASGNQSGQGTLTVSNIDKIVPSAFTITSSNLTATGFTITTAALNGTGSGISKVDYYVNDVLKSSSTATTYIVTGLSVQSATAYVIVHDQAGNSTRSTNTLNVSLHTHNDLCYSHKHTVSCYTTHSHSGSSTSGGGCYGGANYIYHTSHNSSCYSYSDYTHTHASYCYITNTTTCYGTVSWSYIGVYVASHTCAGNGTVTADRYSGTCNTCGASKGIFHRNTICSACTYNYEGYLPNTCSKSTTATVLNCGLSEGVTYTSSTLTCTKTSSTIDGISSYYLTCGKTAGQSYLTCGKIENLTLTCGY